MTSFCRVAVAGLAVAFCPSVLHAQAPPPQSGGYDNDIPASFTLPQTQELKLPKPVPDYIKRVEMVPCVMA